MSIVTDQISELLINTLQLGINDYRSESWHHLLAYLVRAVLLTLLPSDEILTTHRSIRASFSFSCGSGHLLGAEIQSSGQGEVSHLKAEYLQRHPDNHPLRSHLPDVRLAYLVHITASNFSSPVRLIYANLRRHMLIRRGIPQVRSFKHPLGPILEWHWLLI